MEKKAGKWEELFITTDSVYQIVEYKDGKKTGGFRNIIKMVKSV